MKAILLVIILVPLVTGLLGMAIALGQWILGSD
jgi:hypothetical protein